MIKIEFTARSQAYYSRCSDLLPTQYPLKEGSIWRIWWTAEVFKLINRNAINVPLGLLSLSAINNSPGNYPNW